MSLPTETSCYPSLLFIPDWPRTHYIDLSGFTLEIVLPPLTPMHWDCGNVSPWPASLAFKSLDTVFITPKGSCTYLACLGHSDHGVGNLILSEGSRWCELGTVEGSVNVDWKCRSKGGIGLRGGGAQKMRALGGSWQDWVVRGDMANGPHLVSCS